MHREHLAMQEAATHRRWWVSCYVDGVRIRQGRTPASGGPTHLGDYGPVVSLYDAMELAVALEEHREVITADGFRWTDGNELPVPGDRTSHPVARSQDRLHETEKRLRAKVEARRNPNWMR